MVPELLMVAMAASVSTLSSDRRNGGSPVGTGKLRKGCGGLVEGSITVVALGQRVGAESSSAFSGASGMMLGGCGQGSGIEGSDFFGGADRFDFGGFLFRGFHGSSCGALVSAPANGCKRELPRDGLREIVG
jgi:hypothetical protein